MCTYLAKRGSTYYFRRVIPVELRSALGGKAEFMLSLRTKDREQAKRLIHDKAKETDRLLDEARRRLGCFVPLNRVSASPFTQALDPFAGMSEEAIDHQQVHEAEETRRAIAEDEAWDEATRWEAGLSPDHHAARLLREAREERDRYRGRYRRRKQRDEQTETLPKSPGGPPHIADANRAEEIPGVMLDPTIVDLWAAERKVVQKGIDTHRGVVRWFYERVGRKAVDQIKRFPCELNSVPRFLGIVHEAIVACPKAL